MLHRFVCDELGGYKLPDAKQESSYDITFVL